MKLLCVDLKTTDFHENGGQIVEIAAALLHENGEKYAEFQSYLKMKPGEIMSQGAFDRHGLTVPFIQENGQEREVVLSHFAKWLLNNGVNPEGRWQAQFLGQNIVGFDLKFFWDWWGVDHRGWAHYTSLDTMMLAELINRTVVKALGPDTEPFTKLNANGILVPSASLEAQAKYFKLDYSGAHGAKFDVDLTIASFNKMSDSLAADLRRASIAQPT